MMEIGWGKSSIPFTFQVSKLHRGLQADRTTKHIPWGFPQLSSKIFQNNTVKLLYQPTFTSAFNSVSSLPLWVSQTLNFTEVMLQYVLGNITSPSYLYAMR